MSVLRDLRNSTLAPAETAGALPFRAYIDGDVFDLEMDRIFGREWIAICCEAELPAPGHCFADTIAGEPIVAVRAVDGQLRAFFNLCRHRGTPLAEPGLGHVEHFTCPYHAWTCDQTGELIAVPHDRTVRIDKSTHHLQRLGLEVWAGIVFVNLDPRAEPLSKRIRGLDAYVDRFAPRRFAIGKSQEPVQWQANWKIIFENGIESYHLFKVHRDTLETVTPTRGAYYLEGSAPWTVTGGRLLTETKKRRWGATEALGDFERQNYLLISIPPAFVAILTDDALGWFSVDPISPTATRLRAGALSEFPGDRANEEFYQAFMAEDKATCERVQTGMQSRRAWGGRFVDLERVVVDFHHYLGWRLFDDPLRKRFRSPDFERLGISDSSTTQ